MELKPMPSDQLTEEAVIASVLIAPDRRREAKGKLSPSDFWDSRNRKAFEIICECDGDLIAVLAAADDELKNHIMRVSDTTCTSAGLSYYINILKDLGRRRTLIAIAQQIDVQAREADPTELISYIHTKLTALEMQDVSRALRGVHISNIYTAEKSLKAYAEYVDTLRECRFITGIREIDRVIRGVGPGEVLSIIARAGTFKTALLQNLLLNYISNSAWGALFFSLEMPVPNITERYGQMIDQCTGQGIEDQYTQDGADLYRQSFETRYKDTLKNLFVVPTKVSLQEIIRYVDLVQREFKIKIGVIGIDYLGLIDAPTEKEYEVVSKLARGVKDVAKFLNVPVVDLVQTSRKAGTGDTEIEMDMGRGSGAIEEAGDFVIGLFSPEKDVLVAKILKNRKGPKGFCWRLDLNMNTFKIGPDAQKWEAPHTKEKKQRGMNG